MIETVRRIPLALLAGVFCLYGFVLLLAATRWYVLLWSFGIHTGFFLAVRLMFIGLFFNNMMPSITGGDIVKGFYLTRGTATKKFEAVASILLDRIFGLMGLVVLAATASLFALNHEILGPLARWILLFVGFFIASIIVILTPKAWKRLPGVGPALQKLRNVQAFAKFYNVMTALRHHLAVAAAVLFLSIMLQGLLVCANYMLAQGLGIKGLNLGQFFVLIPIAGFISAMPVSFAGWGIGEGAYRSLFMLMNPQYGSVAVVLSILYRLTCLVYSLAGLPFYLSYRHEPIREGAGIRKKDWAPKMG